ncbi:MAG: hypothetical protein P8Y44_07655 [Acidobacteriota bacterium]
MQYFASVQRLTGMGVPRSLSPGSLELGLEVGWVPSLSEEERRVGFSGTKVEDLNRTSFFGRPRLLIGLPRDFSLTLSWVPPVEAFGVEPHLVAVGVARPVWMSDRWRLGLGFTAQYGTIRADLTCSQEDVAGGDDLRLNPFGCEEPSNDEMTIRTAGLELSAGHQFRGAPKLEPYVSLATTFMDLDFQVDAKYSGLVDRTLLLTEGWTAQITAGTRYTAGARTQLGVELFYSPLAVVRPPNATSDNEGLFNVRAYFGFSLR